VQQTEALGTLTGYAFITERQQTVPGFSKERLFDMHRLVHIALIWWLEGHGKRADWAGTAAARVEELVPYGGHEGKEVWGAYLPHVSYVSRLIDVVGGAMSATLLERLGRCQESLGHYASADTSHRKASSLMMEVVGPEHPDTLTSVYCLAYLLAEQHRVDESLLLYQRASAGYNTTLGKDHPTTVACHQHYATLCALQEPHQLACPPTTLDSGAETSTRKRSRQSRELADTGIRSSNHQRR
jgi:hypothetical protein